MEKPYFSVVVPARDEEKSIALLYEEIYKAVKPLNRSFEIVFIDDGSRDATFKEIKKLHGKDEKVKGFRLRGNNGKSIALQTGFDNALGEIIFTLDADLQDDPREIPKLLEKLEEGYDMVS